MAPRISAGAAPLKSVAPLKSAAVIVSMRVIEGVVISEDPAVGDVSVVVINDIVVMPVRSPVVPSPTKSAKIADSKAQPKRDSRTLKEQSRIPIPAWPNPDGLSIRKPWIIFRH